MFWAGYAFSFYSSSLHSPQSTSIAAVTKHHHLMQHRNRAEDLASLWLVFILFTPRIQENLAVPRGDSE
jgi:hypothetical protein